MKTKLTKKYQNIVISSLPGSGRSTLARLLHNKLSGWELFSGGQFMRQYAIEKGLFSEDSLLHHSQEIFDDNFDRKIDMGMRQWLTNRHSLIIESWLCGFLAQGIPNVLKVLLVCKKSLRIDRIANRDEVGVTKAKKNMESREKINCEKWDRIYDREWEKWVVKKDIISKKEPKNYWDHRLYDLVIDTYLYSKEETFEIAYNTFSKRINEKYHVSQEWLDEHKQLKINER